MKKITMFMADDGRIFRTEKECLHYEENLYSIFVKKDIVLFDENKTIIETKNIQEIVEFILDKVMYIQVKSTECLNLLHREIKTKTKASSTFANQFCDTVNKTGLYIFYDNCWLSIENYLQLYELNLRKNLFYKK